MESPPSKIAALPSAENLEKVYAEAGQWVRMCNEIIWQMSSIFVGLSIGSLPFAVQYPAIQSWVAIASFFLFLVWVTASHLYRRSSSVARDVLIQIEAYWNIPEIMSVYRRQGQVGYQRWSLFRMQVVILIVLAAFWIVLLIFFKR
jgi:hypothetical protein